MKLGDLLYELRYNILHDRSDRIPGSTSDYLWTDESLVNFINQAHIRFAREALIIRDGSTPEVTQIFTQTGVNMYPLHPSILAVISAKVVGDSADLARAGHSSFDTYRQPDSYFFDPSQLSVMPPGKPLAFDTDEYFGFDDNDSTGVVTMRVYPVPSAGYNNLQINLRVIRLPLYDLTINNLNAVPEIPPMHHLEMLDWAAYLALRIVDVDAGWAARANEFRQSFEAHVLKAKNDMMRRLFVPMQWGFGRNGFTWEK